MSLRSKIVLVLLAVVVLYTTLDNGAVRFAAGEMFSAWERDDAARNLGRVESALERHHRELRAKAEIWANLDATRRIVEGDESARADFDRARAASAADVFFVVDASGRVRSHDVVDPIGAGAVRLAELPTEEWERSHQLFLWSPADPGDAKSGLMMTEGAPLLVASVPVRPSTGEALLSDGHFRYPSLGVVVVGRFLDDELKREIGAPSDVEIEVTRVDDARLDEALYERIPELTADESTAVIDVGEDERLHMLAAAFDLRTHEPLLIHGVADRRIHETGQRAVDYALLSTLAASFLILLVLLRLLQRIVLNPLSDLARRATEIGRTDDTTMRLGMERDDEVGQLANEFDDMLAKLADSRAQVVHTARLAGMSEIASGVLHNVGNVLNSVNVSANLVTKSAEKLSVADLERMVEVLRANGDDLATFVREDPRGKHTLPFLIELTRTLSTQRDELLTELRGLGDGIDHIADLVRSQQAYAGTRGVFEYASLGDEVEAALRICMRGIEAFDANEVVRQFEDVPALRVDKHKLMEILVNLLRNAHQALQVSGQPDKRITVRVLALDDDIARIEVEDNGVGIAAEDLSRVFHHGFTTKPDGHGFGLHVSANAATEMNASLHAWSGGAGKGATFVLDIPAQRELVDAA